jgi:FKBP-type peptidyl-prolyl cis-trans isomerase SlyD
MTIGKDKVVTIDYTLTDSSGQVIDTSKGHAPLSYLQGAGNLIPGLERALEGKSTGDELKVTIEPDEAYGQRDDALIQTLPKAKFKGGKDVAVGMQFTTEEQISPKGTRGSRIVTVTNVAGDNVTIDANHPLAGVPLTFDVKVVDVRDATSEEISHRHVHGAGGHHH